MTRVSADGLERFLAELFIRSGAAQDEAVEVAHHLVESNLAGHDSHGVLRAPWYLEKIDKAEIVPGAPIVVEHETATTARINGNWGFGQPVARQAMELAIRKAADHALGCVTVRQANHVGRLGAYTLLAPPAGMVGIGMANLHGTSHCVAPFGGIDRKLPTNPISIAFPSGGATPFLLDMTSSIVAEGKLKMKLNREEQLPAGWAIDSTGAEAAWPSQFYDEPKGAILPLGGLMGHKGFALSLAIDALSGALSGADTTNPRPKRHGNACLFLAMRIDAFCAVEEFSGKVAELITHVKAARPMPGTAGVQMPGEPEQATASARRLEGLEIDPTTWRQLTERATRLGVSAEGLDAA